MSLRLGSLVALWTVLACSLAGAQTAPQPLPLTPPPPDLTPMVLFTQAPIDKPTIPVQEVALPEVPEVLPALPPAAIVLPADRPTAPVPPPRTMPCALALLRIPSESLECGLARYGRGEFDEAARYFEVATRSSDADVQREGRYWLAESYWVLGRVDLADRLFRQVAQTPTRDELGLWSQHASGWTAMRMGEFGRARDTFARLMTVPLPPPLDSWTRHGLALSLYAQRRFDEAAQTWSDLMGRGGTRTLARDVFFWHGESLGRVAQHGRAYAELSRFVRGGAHPLLDTGLLRAGWWALLGQLHAESAAAFRSYFTETQRVPRPAATGSTEHDWADAGFALALLRSGPWDAARTAVKPLQARQSPLTIPVLLQFAAVALEKRRPADVQAIVQDLLAAKLDPKTRAWVLVASGDAHRIDGNRDEARTQYQLVRTVEPSAATAAYAAYRLAQTNFELREFAQTVTDLSEALGTGLPPALRAPALLLQAEAAYAAGNYTVADAAYRRVLLEVPTHPQLSLVRFSIGWVALRRQQPEDARQHFAEFARTYATHPNAADALVLASELALAAGDLDGARQILDQVTRQYPAHPRTEFARLNRGILMVRSGNIAGAQAEIGSWLARTPFPPLVGRARAALGSALLAARRPGEAAREFTQAHTEGVGAFASLGLGTAAMGQARWSDATREFTEARDSGTLPIASAAEYGLAAVAFQRGSTAEFKKSGQAALDAAPAGPLAPGILYVLTGIAVSEKDWLRALTTAKRLNQQFPGADSGDDALERIGAAAMKVRDWPAVLESYQLLRQLHPRSPFIDGSRLAFAEALFETGRAEEARRELEPVVDALPAASRGHALLLLARARQARGDRPGALEAYNRAARESRGSEWSPDLFLSHARLLIEDRRWEQARGVLDRLIKSEDQGLVMEAAQAVAQTYQGEGDYFSAAEYFMTSAYLSPESTPGRRAMLAAAQSFAALKQPDSAAIVYKKLLAQGDLPADIASAARQGLAALGR